MKLYDCPFNKNKMKLKTDVTPNRFSTRYDSQSGYCYSYGLIGRWSPDPGGASMESISGKPLSTMPFAINASQWTYTELRGQTTSTDNSAHHTTPTNPSTPCSPTDTPRLSGSHKSSPPPPSTAACTTTSAPNRRRRTRRRLLQNRNKRQSAGAGRTSRAGRLALPCVVFGDRLLSPWWDWGRRWCGSA